jgi:hypothetical protein
MSVDTKYFYMWIHPYTNKTCYGITGSLRNRRDNYRGHNGFDIEWSFIVRGSVFDIEKLEYTLKQKIKLLEEHMGQKISYGNFEWIEAEVAYDSIEALILNFIEEDNYDSVTVIKSKKMGDFDTEIEGESDSE